MSIPPSSWVAVAPPSGPRYSPPESVKFEPLPADGGKRLKPAAEAYENAARDLGVATREIRMVAAHVWDVQGAMRVGCAAAFVDRPGAVWNPLLERPDIVGPDLGEIAERVIEVDR